MDRNASWDKIYAREEKWSRDADPFHGVFRKTFGRLMGVGESRRPGGPLR